MTSRERAVTKGAHGERLNTRAAGVIALAVLMSRILGMVRLQVFAALFGAGRLMDVFFIAFRIPNLLRDMVGEGALSTAFVTTFSKTIAREGDQSAWRLANKVVTLTAVGVSALVVLGIVVAPWLVALLGWGFDPAKAALTVELTRVMYPFILIVSLAALVMGMLNARNVFGVPALASTFFNLGFIITGAGVGWWLDPHFGPKAVLGLAIGVLVGGVLQLGVQIPSLLRFGYRYRPDFRWRDPGVKAMLLIMGPSVIAASTVQVNVVVNSAFASTLGNGPISWLGYAFRLMQFPIGMFGVALGTVSLPMLSRLAVAGDLERLRSELARGLRMVFFLTVPAAIGLIVLAGPIVSVLYQHGRFTAYEAHQTAGALRFYSLGLCGYAALKVLVNAFYAVDRRRTPMVVSLSAMGLNLLLCWLTTQQWHWGARGLAFSTAMVATVNFLVLYALMRRHLGRLDSRAMLVMFARLGLAGALLALSCWGGEHWLLPQWAHQPFWPKLGALAAVIVIGAGAFFGSAMLLGIGEMRELVQILRRKLHAT
jgi:putative peptidoglycan lipid II flippase